MKPLSFSGRLKAGWSKADLMRYYLMNELQYQKVLESLQGIKSEVNI
jgi:hypothetical protein